MAKDESFAHGSIDPTRLGTVEDVSGATVRIKLGDETATGLVFVNGEGYRVGQVGSFIRIPAGYIDLFGIVSQVGAGAAPVSSDNLPLYGDRWLRAELVGEGGRGRRFDRGVSRFPSIGDVAHVVTDTDLARIYAPGDLQSYVSVGRVASATSINAYLNLDKLVSRHAAIVGSTGAGKSTTVAGLIHVLANREAFPAARIVVLDLHGEYAHAFGDDARVFRINADEQRGERPLNVPFWALTADELASLTTGTIAGPNSAFFIDWLTEAKKKARPCGSLHGLSESGITSDTPLPFCIHQLWLDWHHLQYATHTRSESQNQGSDSIAYALDSEAKPLRGDALGLTRPKFLQIETKEPRIYRSANAGQPRTSVDSLESRLRDPRMSFLFKPGPWSVRSDGSTEKDLDALLNDWVGIEHPISILDLSGIPPGILEDLVGVVLRILYDGLFWGRYRREGGRMRPLLIALEEAHNYLGSNMKSRASVAARRIAKEGRKYGVGLLLISQRPSEIDPTILSQCGTTIAMRLTNEADRAHVRSCAADNLDGLFGMLPILRTGEALIIGEAVGLPVRALIDLPPANRRPDSDDPLVVVPRDSKGQAKRPGGWKDVVEWEDYSAVVQCWRRMDPSFEAAEESSNPDVIPTEY